LNEALLCPGEVFNSERIKLTEKRLENIGYFKKVNVFAVRPEESELCGNYRDVHIEVEETSTGRFGLFLGFSTSDSFFGGVTLSENNFNSQGIAKLSRCGTRALRGGGEYLNLSLQAGVRSKSYELSWTKPYFMNTKWSIGFDLERAQNNYIDKDVDITSLGLTMRMGRQLNPFLRVQFHQRLRNSHVDYDEYEDDNENANPNAEQNADPNQIKGKKKKHIDEHLKHLTDYDGLVSAFGMTLTYDSTDSVGFPTKGFRSSLEAELAGLGGQYNFLAFAYLNTYYYQFKENLVLKYRADLRFIFPFGKTTPGTMPLDERLYLGGNTLVRGFKPYKLGPHFKGTDIPKGGVSQQFYSIELNQRWSKRFDGFLFMDVGFLTERTFDFTLKDYRAAYGFGLRISILDSLPPVSLGLGFPINPPHRHDAKNFFLQFGCKF
jgi:outer membrane protein insertion porin family